MATEIIKELDPRLRQALLRSSEAEELTLEASAGLVTDYYPELLTAADFAASGGWRESRPLSPRPTPLRSVFVTLAPDEIPAEFEHLEWSKVCTGIYTLSASVHMLARLASAPQVKSIEVSRPMYPALDTSVHEIRADHIHSGSTTLPPLRGSGVLIGIIDFGLDFTHDDFRDANGDSRIEFLWDQSLTPSAAEHSPPNRSYGVEYTKQDINAALGTSDPFAHVRHKPVGFHGTHVAGIAAGNGRSGSIKYPAGKYVGMAPEAGIIFVQPDLSDRATLTQSRNVGDAVAYIFEQARSLGQPCVINVSLTHNGGSHDGESALERQIDTLLIDRGRAVVVAAGNEQSFAVHASGCLSVGESRTFEWLFGGEPSLGYQDETRNELEIWYSSRDVFDVRLIDPTGFETPWISIDRQFQATSPNGDEIFISSERFTRDNGDSQILVTVGDEDTPAKLTSGIWRVEIRAVTVRDGGYHAWIERDRRDPLRGDADQSVFSGEHFDGVMTLAQPGTSRRAIAVANYDHSLQQPSPSSSRGGTRDGREKPELAAPGVDIRSACALAGTKTGHGTVPVRIQLSGTSMSAPHVAGMIALMFEKNPRLSADQIRSIVIASAVPMSVDGKFDIAWGYGKADALAALELVP